MPDGQDATVPPFPTPRQAGTRARGVTAPAGRPMRVLVTGASGFVGRAIVDHLAAKGFAVRAAARRRPPARAGVEDVALGDLARPVSWDPLLEGMEAVVHAAGCAQQAKGQSDSLLFRINAEATGDLAAAARRHGIARFVLVSSVRAVCGATHATVVDDDTAPAPADAYGRSKLAGEQAAQAGCGAMVLRPVVVHGAGAGQNLRLVTRLAASPWPLPVAGFAGRRSLVSDRNLADAVAFLLARGGEGRASFLVADAEPLTIPALVALLRAALGRPPGLFSPPQAFVAALQRAGAGAGLLDRLTGDMVVRCDGLAALGWSPPEASARGLARMIGAARDSA